LQVQKRFVDFYLADRFAESMNTDDSNATMAVFLDLENIALGAQEAHYPAFAIKKVVERLLLKGHIVVKKAYCDFDRYKDFKRGLHEAAFELIEIPHLRQSGKNSADIRMVVDALDLCYTKGHVDTFVIISGDSDFSPLVSKLRENAKTVIGVGVKKSSSDLFINNCDQFIYYDDLVRAAPSKVNGRGPAAVSDAKAAESKGLTVAKAIELVVQTKKPRIQRTRLRLPFLQRSAVRGPETRAAEITGGREVRRISGATGGAIEELGAGSIGGGECLVLQSPCQLPQAMGLIRLISHLIPRGEFSTHTGLPPSSCSLTSRTVSGQSLRP
jgi:uncharacterized protein (TIGR00288 family)